MNLISLDNTSLIRSLWLFETILFTWWDEVSLKHLSVGIYKNGEDCIWEWTIIKDDLYSL